MPADSPPIGNGIVCGGAILSNDSMNGDPKKKPPIMNIIMNINVKPTALDLRILSLSFSELNQKPPPEPDFLRLIIIPTAINIITATAIPRKISGSIPVGNVNEGSPV